MSTSDTDDGDGVTQNEPSLRLRMALWDPALQLKKIELRRSNQDCKIVQPYQMVSKHDSSDESTMKKTLFSDDNIECLSAICT